MKTATTATAVLSSAGSIAAEVSAAATIDGMNFIAIGDWGGKDTEPYTQRSQVQAAAGMAKVAKEQGSKFVLALGDNMYWEGIDASSDCHDFRFQKTFEEVYFQPELQIPWYIIAGNHDWRGNVEAQIEYSALSERWNFPDYNHGHKFSWSEGGEVVEVEVIMIDTKQLAGLGPDVAPDHPLYFSQPRGPANVTLASETYDWVEEKLQASTADYLWVAGHYPVYSACPHGSTESLLDNLKPMLDQYGAHYMCGHDHCQMHIQDDKTLTNYLVTGSGEMVTYEKDPNTQTPQGWLKYLLAADENPTKAVAGFTSFSTTSKQMKVTIHDEKGDDLYAFEMAPRTRQQKKLLDARGVET